MTDVPASNAVKVGQGQWCASTVLINGGACRILDFFTRHNILAEQKISAQNILKHQVTRKWRTNGEGPMSITRKYGETVHAKIPPYFGTFPPVTDVNAGDVGVLMDGVFQRLDTATALGLELEQERSTGYASQFSITSGKDVSVSTQVGSGIADDGAEAETELRIQFARKDGFFLAAQDCEEQVVSDELSIHNRIIDLFMNGTWKPEWYFVRAVTKAENLTWLTSAEGGAEITFQGHLAKDADEAKLKLKAGLKVASKGSFGAELIGESGSPFVKLLAVRRKFLTGEQIIKLDLIAPESFAVLENSRRQCIEQGSEPHEFFQLREINENDTLF